MADHFIGVPFLYVVHILGHFVLQLQVEHVCTCMKNELYLSHMSPLRQMCDV